MEEKITQYATEILLALIGLLVVYARIWLDRLKKKAEAYYEARTTAEQRKVLTILAKEAFSLAESAAKNLGGIDKLNHAVEYMTRKAMQYGIRITPEEARAAIEAAWLEDKRKETPLMEIRPRAIIE